VVTPGRASETPHRPAPARRRRTAGLTLVELMITLVIGGLVASAAFVFFVGQRRVYSTQAKILDIQQNLWGAMDALTRFVRSAGMGLTGCVKLGDPPPGGATAPQTGLRIYQNGPPGAVSRLAPLWILNGANGAPDKITVVFGSGFGTFSDSQLGASVATATDTIATPANKGGIFRAGDFALLLDVTAAPQGPPVGDRGCTLFQVTSSNAATGVLGHDGTSTWNPTINMAGYVPFLYAGGAAGSGGLRNIGTLNWVEFSIDSTGAPAVPPKLVMRRLDGITGSTAAVTMAEGIEDLQVSYACDSNPAPPNGDGVFTEGTDGAGMLTDEWMYNVAGDVPTVDCNRPQAIRITLLARSHDPDTLLTGLHTNAKPAVEDGAAGTPDTFRHRALTTTVFPRNR
jgi:prepilin-type N-terminal cleavage/methylation domain-containing protein